MSNKNVCLTESFRKKYIIMYSIDIGSILTFFTDIDIHGIENFINMKWKWGSTVSLSDNMDLLFAIFFKVFRHELISDDVVYQYSDHLYHEIFCSAITRHSFCILDSIQFWIIFVIVWVCSPRLRDHELWFVLYITYSTSVNFIQFPTDSNAIIVIIIDILNLIFYRYQPSVINWSVFWTLVVTQKMMLQIREIIYDENMLYLQNLKIFLNGDYCLKFESYEYRAIPTHRVRYPPASGNRWQPREGMRPRLNDGRLPRTSCPREGWFPGVPWTGLQRQRALDFLPQKPTSLCGTWTSARRRSSSSARTAGSQKSDPVYAAHATTRPRRRQLSDTCFPSRYPALGFARSEIGQQSKQGSIGRT